MEREDLIKVFEGDEKTADIVIGNRNFIMPDMGVKEWLGTFSGAFVSRHPKQLAILGHIRKALNKRTEVKWKDFTKLNLRKISDYFNENLSANSACTYIHVLQSLLNQYSEEKVLPTRNFESALKSKHVPSQHVALTQEEVAKFETYVPKNKREKDIKTLFMRAVFTGARCSDVEEMSTDNIVHGINGDMLNYVSNKTKVQVICPVHRNLKKYLEYKVSTQYCAEQMKRVIQKICREVGINEEVSLFVNGKHKTGPKWQFITMHSARRSFVSQLASMGVPLSEISLLAGHTSEGMTSRYVCLNAKHLGHEADAFFKGETLSA